jgi:hypothetical protein
VTQNVLRRVVGSAIAIGLAATVTAVCGAGSAQAATWGYTWTYFDNMEPRSTSQPQDRFFLETDGPFSEADFSSRPSTTTSRTAASIRRGSTG